MTAAEITVVIVFMVAVVVGLSVLAEYVDHERD